MKKLTVYHYAKCGTCRKAIRLLQELGHELVMQDVFVDPPTADELADLVAKSGLPAQRFFNTSGEVYREMNLKDKTKHMDDGEKIRLMSGNGRLIKRPVVTDGKQVTVGFKEDTFRQIWG